MKYNLFEIVGIYVVCRTGVVFCKSLINKYGKKLLKCKTEQFEKSLAIMKNELDEENRRRDKLVLDMYREGYSRQEILDHFGEKWIGKERVERVCDEEDHSWDAEA